MKRIVIATALMAGIVTLSACGKSENNNHNSLETTSSISSSESILTENTTVDNSSEIASEPKEENHNSSSEEFVAVDCDISEEEEELYITEKSKGLFLAQYGQEMYDRSLNSLKLFLKFHNNSDVSDDWTDEYKEKYNVESLILTSSYDKHEIPADYFSIDGDLKRDTVVMVHGHGNTRVNNIGIGKYFLELGYNVLTFDLRRSGENTATTTTFGVLEKYDLLDCVEYVNGKLSDENKLIVWAGSYGGIVTSVALGEQQANEQIDAAILDCPLSNIDEMIEKKYKGKFNIEECNIFLKHFYGFTLDDTDGRKTIADTKVPVLLFTGGKDNVIPMEMVEELYSSIKNENKELKIFEDSGHCMGCYQYPDEYMKTCSDFLAKYCQ